MRSTQATTVLIAFASGSNSPKIGNVPDVAGQNANCSGGPCGRRTVSDSGDGWQVCTNIMIIRKATSICGKDVFQKQSSAINATRQMEWPSGAWGYQVTFPSRQRRSGYSLLLRRMGNIASI
jgi:hypothetical protein